MHIGARGVEDDALAIGRGENDREAGDFVFDDSAAVDIDSFSFEVFNEFLSPLVGTNDSGETGIHPETREASRGIACATATRFDYLLDANLVSEWKEKTFVRSTLMHFFFVCLHKKVVRCTADGKRFLCGHEYCLMNLVEYQSLIR